MKMTTTPAYRHQCCVYLGAQYENGEPRQTKVCHVHQY